MIKVKIVSGEELYINDEFIESIEAYSQEDTTLRLHEGTTFIAKETPEEILAMIVEWKKKISSK